MTAGKISFFVLCVLLLIQCKKENVIETSGYVPRSWPGETAYFTDLEKNTWQAINEYRKSIQLPELIAASVITDQCRNHSQDLVQGIVKPHDGFQTRVDHINRTMNVMSAGEVIYQASGVGEDEMPSRAVAGWLESSAHKAQVEGEFTHMGVGAKKSADGEYFITVIFVNHYQVY
jgi:uncharacterized protein YkwD